MSRFGQRLEEIRKHQRLTKTAFADFLRVDKTMISKWSTGVGLPDKETLMSIANSKVLTDEQAAKLISAWVHETLPGADRYIVVQSKHASAKVNDQREDWPPAITDATKQKFVDLCRLAVNYREVAKIVDLLHAAGKRGGFV